MDENWPMINTELEVHSMKTS